MARNRELPFDPRTHYAPHGRDHDGENPMLARRGLWQQTDRHISVLGALAACAPGEMPETTQGELLPLRDVIQDAIEAVLSERERAVFDAYCVERQSFRALARPVVDGGLGIPRSTAWRVWNGALDKLRSALAEQPLIVEYLGGR